MFPVNSCNMQFSHLPIDYDFHFLYFPIFIYENAIPSARPVNPVSPGSPVSSSQSQRQTIMLVIFLFPKIFVIFKWNELINRVYEHNFQKYGNVRVSHCHEGRKICYYLSLINHFAINKNFRTIQSTKRQIN